MTGSYQVSEKESGAITYPVGVFTFIRHIRYSWKKHLEKKIKQ